MSQVKFLCFALCIVAISISCTNQAKKKTNSESVEEVMIEEATILLEEVPVPNSHEVVKNLNAAGAGYVFDITNKPSNVDNYLTLKQQALNLGVYTADLSYATVYQKKDEISAYIQCFAQLATNLQIGSVNEDVLKRFEANIDNSDSILALIDVVFTASNSELGNDERSDIALFAFSGSWIEGMFIVEKTIEFAANPAPLWDILKREHQALTSLLKVMEIVKDHENVSDLYNSLSEIKVLFDKLEDDSADKASKELLVEKIKELRYSII
jgi:hypothetical protein